MKDGTHGDKVSALILYAVVSSVMATSWLLVFSYLARHPELLADEVPAGFFRAEQTRAALGIVAPGVPVLVGLFSPTTALLLLAVMPIFYALTADGLPPAKIASNSS
jgi:hypothetical protein